MPKKYARNLAYFLFYDIILGEVKTDVINERYYR